MCGIPALLGVTSYQCHGNHPVKNVIVSMALGIYRKAMGYYLPLIKKLSTSLEGLGGQGWRITSCVVATLLTEPVTAGRFGIVPLIPGWHWKSVFEKHSFYDAADKTSLIALKNALIKNKIMKTPVLLLHGLASSPDIFSPWAKQLREARDHGLIGHVISLQLPNNLQNRMKLVYEALDAISEIYKELGYEGNIDLVGHSLGGYAAHLAAYMPKGMEIIDDGKNLRRWHGMDKRNEKVRKVVTIAGPTWLCCKEMDQEAITTYHKNIFKTKNIEQIYSEEQLNTLKNNHENIYDIVASEDVISPLVSPLPKDQIYYVEHGHTALMTCQDVCKLVTGILSN